MRPIFSGGPDEEVVSHFPRGLALEPEAAARKGPRDETFLPAFRCAEKEHVALLRPTRPQRDLHGFARRDARRPSDGRQGVEDGPVEERDEDALVTILTQPRNALSKQYARLFEMENVELEVREDGLRAVARKAMERKTGARGLRTILENVLLDIMYDLPSLKNVAKVVVDETVILGDSKPYLVYRSDESQVAVPEIRRAAGSDTH
jgi:hypothetical protein